MEQQTEKNICPHCGCVLTSGAIFCAKCRKILMSPPPVTGSDKQYKAAFIVMYTSFCLMLVMFGLLVFNKWDISKDKSLELRKTEALVEKQEKPVIVREKNSSGLFTRIKQLVIPAAQASPAVTKSPAVSESSADVETCRIVSWDIQLKYSKGSEHSKPHVYTQGSIRFAEKPAAPLTARLYSSSTRDGEYVLCGEGIIKNTTRGDLRKDSTNRIEDAMRKTKDPRVRARLARSLELSKKSVGSSSRFRKIFDKIPLSYVRIIAADPLRYKRNNIWIRLEILSGRKLVQAFPTVKVPLVSYTYDSLSKKRVYKTAFPKGDPVNFILLYKTGKYSDKYFIWDKLKHESVCVKGQNTENGEIVDIKEVYPDGFPGWLSGGKNTGGSINAHFGIPVAACVGIDYQGRRYLISDRNNFELTKIICRNVRIYPVSKNTFKYYFDHKPSLCDQYFLPELGSVKELKVLVKDRKSGYKMALTLSLPPSPPKVKFEKTAEGIRIKWGSAESGIDPENWLAKPALILCRVSRKKTGRSDLTHTIYRTESLKSGAYVDRISEKDYEKLAYRLAYTGGAMKDFFYTSNFKKKEFYIIPGRIFEYNYFCKVRNDNPENNVRIPTNVGRPVRVAVKTPKLYHDNTGPASARIMTGIISKINKSRECILYDRTSREAVEQEMIMTQSLEKVKKLFSESPVDVVIQARDRSTANGDYVELWVGNLNQPLHIVYKMGTPVYHSYNNAWRIGRINISDPDWNQKTEAFAAEIVNKIKELRPGGVKIASSGKTPEKFVWGGLSPVNQGYPVNADKLEGMSESLMLAVSEQLKHGDMLSRDNWAQIRQERDFSDMNGKETRTDAGGQVLITGSVVNLGCKMEFHFTATEVYTSEVIGCFSYSGTIEEVGRNVGNWCNSLLVSDRRSSPYDDKMAKHQLKLEEGMARLISHYYTETHVLKSKLPYWKPRPAKSLKTGAVAADNYAARQWAYGNRKYAIELLEKEYKAGNKGVKRQLVGYYHAVGLFDKEKILLETYQNAWAITRLAQMSEFPPEKPKYSYLDSSPEKLNTRGQSSIASARITNISSLFRGNSQYKYSRIRPVLADSWNSADIYTTYSPAFLHKGKGLEKFARSEFIRNSGIIWYINSNTFFKQYKCMVGMKTWQAMNVFDRKLSLALTRGLLLDVMMESGMRYDFIINSFFTRPQTQLLENAGRNLNMSVDFFSPHKTRNDRWGPYRPVTVRNIEHLFNIYISEMRLIPDDSQFSQRPNLYKIIICDIMAKRGNSRAREFINWVKQVKIPSVDPNEQYIKEVRGNVNYRMLSRLNKHKINQDIVIYRAAHGSPDAIKLIKDFPSSFVKSEFYNRLKEENIVYYMVKHFKPDLLNYVLQNAGLEKSYRDSLRILRFAGKKRLEDILLADDQKIARKLKEYQDGKIYYYLLIGLDSKKVTDFAVEKLRRFNTSDSDNVALLHLTGIPPSEFLKSKTAERGR